MTDLSNFRMPAEWEPHRYTLLAWPLRKSDWPQKLSSIPWVYGEIIRYLVRSEDVILVVPNMTNLRGARKSLRMSDAPLKRVFSMVQPTDRSWVRDIGPVIVRRGDTRVALDWGFNAWAKYEDFQKDDELAAAVAHELELPVQKPIWNERRVVLEGGGIEVNGTGTLLVTEEWLLSDTQVRNPGFTRADYEAIFAKYLGITKTVWLGRGIVGDDTHGHVDDISRFVSPDTVLTAMEADESDPNHVSLKENKERLQAAGLNVIDLPMPDPVMFNGQRLPASYANFYIANGIVLVPTFNDRHDRTALGILGECFPEREVVGIHSVDLVWGLGTLHCLSQQIPA